MTKEIRDRVLHHSEWIFWAAHQHTRNPGPLNHLQTKLQQAKATAVKKKPVVIQERSKRIWSAKLDKIAEENGGVIPSPRVKDEPPTTNYGPRGGRYTEDKTKDGRPYRRYF